MTFTAKHSGRCNAVECVYGDWRISEGDAIAFVDDELAHEACASHYRDRQHHRDE